jgi:transposase InsO family protein/transposase-like protein
MPWKEACVVELRAKFVREALREDRPFAELCRRHGISAKTGYKWKQRFEAGGLPALADASRRPHRPRTAVDEQLVCELVRLKLKHLRWGPAKIRTLLQTAHPGWAVPSLSTVKRLLERAGLVEPRRRRVVPAGRLTTTVTAAAPNDLWTVDFKGWWYTPCKQRVLPLTVCDAFSRYVLLARIIPDSSAATVQQCFTELFDRHGLPQSIRSDNGTPFACSTAPLGLSRLACWWLALGISLDRIAPGHPEQNGSHERMHREIAREVEGRIDGDLRAQQAALDIWREEFNALRPHAALGLRCPAELYRPSPRRFVPPASPLYPPGFWRRKVSPCGCIRLGNWRPLITTALRGWHIGLEPQPQGFQVWFSHLHLGELQLRERAFVTTARHAGTILNAPVEMTQPLPML